MASMIPSYYGGRRTSNILDPFSLDVWDPSEGFGFPSMLTTSSTGDRTGIANTRVDWRETPEAHIFTADLPGLKKDEVKVDLEDERVLVISGERAREREEDTDKWHRVERQRGKFTRRFRLPENAALDAIKANMEHGVLTVTVPKHPGRTPQTKSVNIAG